MNYYLLFIFILDYGNDVWQKANSSSFFFFQFELKIDPKAAETTHNISDRFGSGIANECKVQWWFKKFWKGDERPEGEKYNGWP